MQNETQVKVKIADREYSLKTPIDEQERIYNASRIVNEKIKTFREKFGINNEQDLLAMVVFECVVLQIVEDEKQKQLEKVVSERISSVSALLQNIYQV